MKCAGTDVLLFCLTAFLFLGVRFVFFYDKILPFDETCTISGKIITFPLSEIVIILVGCVQMFLDALYRICCVPLAHKTVPTDFVNTSLEDSDVLD
jgi:hypothetical protein